MAWIKSYQEIERHPKTIVLMKEMDWPLDVAISKLHRLWWWCADYATDGDISKHDPDTISTAIGCTDMRGDFLVAALIKAGFVDKDPYLRLHDWWSHFGDFLRGKYARCPEKWQAIEKCYTNARQTLPKRSHLDKEINKEINNLLPDLSGEFASFWISYPKKVGKGAALKAWKAKKPPLCKCLSALAWQTKSDQWTRDGGQFIPHPATWLNQGRWDDVPENCNIVACSVCGKEGILPKFIHGTPICRECKENSVI